MKGIGNALSKAMVVMVALLVAEFAPGPANGAEVKPIVLGGLPDYASYTRKDFEQGVELAILEINAKGGVSVGGTKRPLKLVTANSRDEQPGAAISDTLLAAEKLILDQKVDFMVGGPARSEFYFAAMDLWSKYKKINIVSFGVMSPAFQKKIAEDYEKYKYSFRVYSDSASLLGMELPSLAEELKTKFGLTKIVIINHEGSYSRGAGDFAQASFSKWGWEVVGRATHPIGKSDFTMDLVKAKEKGAQVLFSWYDGPESVALAQQVNNLKMGVLPIGYDYAISDQDAWKNTNGACAYWMPANIVGATAPANITPATDRYLEAFKKQWGRESTGHIMAGAYTAVYVLADAIERAGSLETDAVIAALEKTDYKDGIYGRIRFDPKGHTTYWGMDPKEAGVGTWFQWQDGKRVTVWPAKIALSNIKLPPKK